ncbi:MAG: type III pantothenate kinase [Bacteriovoracia bacterium]
MIAIVDIGNTRTKLALYGDEGMLKAERTLSTADDFSGAAAGIFEEKISKAVIGSVVPAHNAAWEAFFSARASSVHFASHASPWSFSIEVESPEKVGIDRLANLEAVSDIPGAVLVIDAGTATKFDLLEGVEKRSFPGGAIAPGMAISYEALLNNAAQLNKIELDKFSPVVGYNTETAIRSGVLHGFAAQADGMVMRMVEERRLPSLAAVIATGGNAKFLTGRSRLITQQRPRLTLEGLYALARKI